MSDKELNSVIDRAEDEYQKLKDKVVEQGLEIERLNNIIDELEKELDLNLPFKVVGVRHLKNKLQELKGSDKE